MILTTLAHWVPRFRVRIVAVGGSAPGELAAMDDRIIADLGMLWCDLAYRGHDAPPIA